MPVDELDQSFDEREEEDYSETQFLKHHLNSKQVANSIWMYTVEQKARKLSTPFIFDANRIKAINNFMDMIETEVLLCIIYCDVHNIDINL